jgi:hypothetical protein
MSAQREPLRELALLLRAPELGSTNLGSYLAEQADVMAPLLQTTPRDLRAGANDIDEVVVPKLLRRLESVERELRDECDRRRTEVSIRAAHTLGATARWLEERAVLEVDLLLGDFLADKHAKFVAFEDREGKLAVTVARWMLADVRPLRRIHMDLVAWVDTEGFHFRWRGGRGALNWRPQVIPAGAQTSILTVPLHARRVRQTHGAWLGDVLQELGFPA